MSIAAITGPTAPKRWVEKVGRSIKGSDTPQEQAGQISYFSLGDKNRLPRRRRGPVPLPLDCESLIFARCLEVPNRLPDAD